MKVKGGGPRVSHSGDKNIQSDRWFCFAPRHQNVPHQESRGLGNRLLSLTLLWWAISMYSHKQSNMGEMSSASFDSGRASSVNRRRVSKAGRKRRGSRVPQSLEKRAASHSWRALLRREEGKSEEGVGRLESRKASL